MLDQFYEVLARNGIRDASSALRATGSYSNSRLIALNHELEGAINEAAVEDPSFDLEAKAGIAGFDFAPNSDLGASLGACLKAQCRAERIGRLTRFATMWADSVCLYNYFELLPESADEEFRREWLRGSLQAVFQAEPAIRAGFVSIMPTFYRFCPACIPQVDTEMARVRARLAPIRGSLQAKYVGEVTAKFDGNAKRLHLEITGPQELLPQGIAHTVWNQPVHDLPAWLPMSVKQRLRAGEEVTYGVPKSKLLRFGLLERQVDQVIFDVVHQHYACKFRGLSYLTNRPIDVHVLNMVNENEAFTPWNAILAKYLEYQTPVLENVPLEDLIDLRKSDYDAFIVYRDTLKDAIMAQVTNRPVLTGQEAREIYEDIVRPAYNKMNLKLRSVRAKLSSKLRREVVIASSVLAVGLTTGLIASEPAGALAAAGGVAFAVNAARTLLERVDAPDELRDGNFYFFWRAAQRARHQ